jgi:outer membrane protein TolC
MKNKPRGAMAVLARRSLLAAILVLAVAGPPILASDESPPPRVNVRLGPFADRAAAGEAVLMLEEAGIEYFVFPAADDGSVEISVGVFVDPINAERRRDQVSPLGLGEVRIVDYPLSPPRTVEAPALATPPPIALEPAAEAAEEEDPIGGEKPEPATLEAPPELSGLSEPPAMELEIATPADQPVGDALQIDVTPSARRAPDPAATHMTMEQAVSYAIGESPELEGANLQIDLSEADLRRAKGLIEPNILFLHTSTRNDSNTVDWFNSLPDGANMILDELELPGVIPPFVYENSHHTRMVMTQPLFAGGSNLFRISGARAGRDASESWRDDQSAEVLMIVRQAFVDLQAQWEVIGLREESLTRAERSLARAERRRTLGLVARSETLRWQVQVAGERVQLIRAVNAFDVGLERFKRLIGYPPTSPLALDFLTPAQVESLMARGIAELEAEGAPGAAEWIEDHPAVVAAGLQAEAARYQRRASSSDYWPRLDLDGSLGYLENDTLALDEFVQWSVRLRLSIPVWDGGRRASNRARAQTGESLADLQMRVVRDDLFVEDQSVVADLLADLAELENARAAVVQARETVDSVTNKASLGLADYIQQIDAQVVLTQSEVAETSARYLFLKDLFRWWRVRRPESLEPGAVQ